jgi:Uncharacterised protein family UPF0102
MDGELRRAKQTDVKACARLRHSPPHIPRAARLAQVLPGQQEPAPDRPHRDIEHHAATLRALSDPSANAREADKRAPAVLGEFQGLLDRVERIVGGDVMLYSGLRSLADLLKPHNRSGLARRGSVLAVIEVKSRNDAGSAAEALLPRQKRRIARAAEAFLLSRPDLAGLGLRFDVMLVARSRLPLHWQGAWHADN